MVKIVLESKINSLLTLEVGGIVHRLLLNSGEKIVDVALTMHCNYSGHGIDIKNFTGKPLQFKQKYLNGLYKEFEDLHVDRNGFLTIRTKNWNHPMEFYFEKGVPQLIIKHRFLSPMYAINLSKRTYRELISIVVNQHPLENEQQL